MVSALLLLLLLAAPARPVQAAGRVALVVGNSAYEHIGRLPNPENDATDLDAALRRLGFEVTVVRDADRTAMTGALRAFTRRSAGADVALVFYAGHGVEMDGVNYLLPVNARLERDTDVRFETVTLDDMLASTAGAGLRLVILDACRNNPLARSMQRTVRSRNVSNGSFGAVNEDLLGDQTLVAYSAAAGTTADDGDGRNSPYAAALLAHLEDPVEIGILFRRVRARVLSATSGRQRPHEYGALVDEHYLSGSGGGGGGGVAARPTPAGAGDRPVVVAGGLPDPVRVQQETVFWQSAANSTNAADFEAYLARWPNGVYASLARNRLAALRVPTPNPSRPDQSAPARPDPDPAPTHEDADPPPDVAQDAIWSDEDWRAALPRATRYGRPDRTSEGDLDDGSHFEQSEDDRVYRENCRPDRIVGLNVEVRRGTQSLHWRWHTPTGDPGYGVGEWRAYFNGDHVGEVGAGVAAVADTDARWYQFTPGRAAVRRDGRFVLLFACDGAGVQELAVHYHH